MISLLIAGDYYPQSRVKKMIESGDYDKILGEIKPLTHKTDYSIVNFECPILPLKGETIIKCGPNLSASVKAIEAIKYAGFDMLTLANNHIYDYGDEGVVETLSSCSNYGIDYTGCGFNINESQKTFYKVIKNKTIAIINVCEHEFTIATRRSSGANPLDPIKNFSQIKEARQKADYVIMIIHGGHEHYQLPSPRMKETYRFFIDAGADALVNHHQHCFSGYEIYKGKPIFYGLGNFSFDSDQKRDSSWNKGYFVILKLDESNCNFEVFPYMQGNITPGISLLKDKAYSDFFFELESLNKIISDDDKLLENHNKFMSSTMINYSGIFEPYQNRYLMALYNRRLFPSLFTKKKALKMLNIIECEAHYERTLFFLKQKIYNDYDHKK